MNNKETNVASIETTLIDQDCYPDRKTVSRIDNMEGEIFLIDNVNFGIRYQENQMSLLPCNLPDALQAEGKKIIFSGDIKETNPTELWAGEPFVITKLKEEK
ncbi:MAG TPA: hypothetical protein VLR49_04115 [Ferruginibacter sp.]|nr:hypothetical protein [Ferruginibacter sp.]